MTADCRAQFIYPPPPQLGRSVAGTTTHLHPFTLLFCTITVWYSTNHSVYGKWNSKTCTQPKCLSEKAWVTLQSSRLLFYYIQPGRTKHRFYWHRSDQMSAWLWLRGCIKCNSEPATMSPLQRSATMSSTTLRKDDYRTFLQDSVAADIVERGSEFLSFSPFLSHSPTHKHEWIQLACGFITRQ